MSRPTRGRKSTFYITDGTLPAEAISYVDRQADKDLLSALLAGEYCYVLNSRQMGKSSLSVRTIARLREDGVRTAFVDLTRIGAQIVPAEQWYAGLLADARTFAAALTNRKPPLILISATR